MQENNNFETIISTWRRLSGELPSEPLFNFASMSGDSPDNPPHKHKEEEATLLMPERAKAPAPAPPVASVAAVAAGAAAAEAQPVPATAAEADQKQEFLQRDKNESKEGAGDTIDDNDDDDYLDNDDKETKKSPKGKTDDNKLDKTKFGDNVDSVYLRPPPPHKTRSTISSATEDEDCGIKCLYYTLQCCDCVLM